MRGVLRAPAWAEASWPEPERAQGHSNAAGCGLARSATSPPALGGSGGISPGGSEPCGGAVGAERSHGRPLLFHACSARGPSLSIRRRHRAAEEVPVPLPAQGGRAPTSPFSLSPPPHSFSSPRPSHLGHMSLMVTLGQRAPGQGAFLISPLSHQVGTQHLGWEGGRRGEQGARPQGRR